MNWKHKIIEKSTNNIKKQHQVLEWIYKHWAIWNSLPADIQLYSSNPDYKRHQHFFLTPAFILPDQLLIISVLLHMVLHKCIISFIGFEPVVE